MDVIDHDSGNSCPGTAIAWDWIISIDTPLLRLANTERVLIVQCRWNGVNTVTNPAYNAEPGTLL